MQKHRSEPIKSLAIVIPAYNESESLPSLIERLQTFVEKQEDLTVRVTIVDDNSDDLTPVILRGMADQLDWLTYLRLARRSGSHVAVIAGLSECTEGAAVFMAADLQDPPELVSDMIVQLDDGHDVVWAVRENNDSRNFFAALASRMFHNVFRYLSDIDSLPFQPSFALLSRRAYNGLVDCFGNNSSFLTEIPRLGFPTTEVGYRQSPRKRGVSKWNIGRKITAFWDAIVTSSHMPMRLMSIAGLFVVGLGFLYALILLLAYFFSTNPVQGWASLMVVMLVLGGFQIVMMEVVGEYVARTKENTRRGPLYFIEDRHGSSDTRRNET